MREIIFRGKRIDNGEWLEGHPYVSSRVGISKIIYALALVPEYNSDVSYYYEAYDVDPDTVSQFTGLRDKNGNRIFEGDIIKMTSNGQSFIGEVSYNEIIAEYRIYPQKGGYLSFEYIFDSIEVIGNKWDNPELLENKQCRQ